ncbi:putative osmostress-responsive transcription factor [Scheffersomyces amazonensis]|uniref:putative osmostress-responsive transcription factor n=1 Tax=Scheffersomyces amazonensis TaxID=1078765 RepID=UPI00315CD3A3
MNDTYSSNQSNPSMYYNPAASSNNQQSASSTSANANNSNTNVSSSNANANNPNNSSTNPNNPAIINDIYSQINQLSNHFNNYQTNNNEKINEMNIKLNFINDSMDTIKHNLNELTQQVLVLIQNNNNNNTNNNNNNNPNISGFYNNQSKVIELFNKHIYKLSKDIEELSHPSNPAVGSGLNPQLRQSQSQQQHPQLHSQHHQLTSNRNSQSNNSQPNNSSNANNNAPTNYTVSGEEVVEDLTRPSFPKSLNLRSPAPQNNSNPASPFIPNRFNFDLNSFSTTRNTNTGTNTNANNSTHGASSSTATFPNFHNLQDNGSTPNLTNNAANNNTDKSSNKKKRRKSSKKDDQQSPRQVQTNQPQQSSVPPALTANNSYILPLPTLLTSDVTSKNNPAAAQFMSVIPRQGDNGSLLRQGSGRQSFFGDDDIDNNIEDLTAGTTANGNTASNQGGNQEDVSGGESNKSKSGKKRKKDDGEGNNNGGSKVNKYSNPLNLPKYRIERSLKSLTDIWKEYEYGLNDKPPLKLLEIKYGAKWRNETESRTFLRRRKIYEAIESGKSKGYTEDQVIQDLEAYRSYEINGAVKKKPLSWLCTNIPDKYVT